VNHVDHTLFRAVEFAVRAHSGQLRKVTPVPYIVHPLGVLRILARHGCGEPIAVAALLHDTVEDGACSLDEIRREFGGEVARLVAEMTEPDKSRPWWDRKAQTLERLKTASQDVLLLACADKLDNLRSLREDCATMGESVWDALRASREQQAWYYRQLGQVFESSLENGTGALLAAEFRREVETLFGPYGS